MDRSEIVVPVSHGEAVFSRSREKWHRRIEIDKMVTNGGQRIHLQKAPQLSKEWGEGHCPIPAISAPMFITIAGKLNNNIKYKTGFE
jgi:hypothetical protein